MYLPVNWGNNFITIGTTFASIIVAHVLIVFLSKIKAKYYYKIEGSMNDRKSKKEASKMPVKILAEDDDDET